MSDSTTITTHYEMIVTQEQWSYWQNVIEQKKKQWEKDPIDIVTTKSAAKEKGEE